MKRGRVSDGKKHGRTFIFFFPIPCSLSVHCGFFPRPAASMTFWKQWGVLLACSCLSEITQIRRCQVRQPGRSSRNWNSWIISSFGSFSQNCHWVIYLYVFICDRRRKLFNTLYSNIYLQSHYTYFITLDFFLETFYPLEFENVRSHLKQDSDFQTGLCLGSNQTVLKGHVPLSYLSSIPVPKFQCAFTLARLEILSP